MDRKILFIFLLAIALRFLVFFPFIYKHPERAFYTIDAYTYEFPAITLIEKGKYINDCPRKIPDWFPQQCTPSREPEIYRPPVYPLYIAGHYILLGYRPEIVIFTQNVMDSLKVILIYHISRIVGLENPYVGAILYAISPSAIIFSQALMTETMQGFILLIFLVLLFSKISYVRSAVLGLVAGILSLTHPLWYFFALFLPILVLIYTRSFKKSLLASFFVVLTISPWMIRNWMIWKKIVFAHFSPVFLCEIYQKMEKGRFFGKDYYYSPYLDKDLFNEASERFGWGVKFNTLDEVKSYQTSLTQELQIAKICREKIIENITRYPIEVHVAGFLKSFPPVGIGMLYYIISGDIRPSASGETAYQIVPLVLRGKILEAIKEIRERRGGLLPLPWFLIYLFSWVLRMLSFILSFVALVKIKPKFSLILFFIFLYGTFLITTPFAAQPRRFHTVEPIIFILASSVFSKKEEEIKT
jgi:ABC-type multidrug transport system fused ATPase/permease subunit